MLRFTLEAGADVVIAAGGDGTVRCVAEVLAGTDTAMGRTPLGTGKLLARNLGIDVVKVAVDRAEEEYVFLVAAGLGYDASIMVNTMDGLKDRVGRLAVVLGVFSKTGKGSRSVR